jgi:manganese transport protein
MAADQLHSLPEVHASVEVPRGPSFWRRLFAFIGPAYLVSVGYMDPGNWATDIAAGSRYGYALLWVLLMSNLMAILLQALSARLGIAAGMDLAQACRAMFSKRVSVVLWLLAEIAIAACDLAEVLGSAIGLQLLFGLPLLAGVLITTLDTFLLLILQKRGMRLMEAFIVVLIATIGICLGVEIILSRPDLGAIAGGFVPALPDGGALFLAIGILGATVMPHNLYLHSALVQSRKILYTPAGIRTGLRFNTIDSVVALNGALFVNAALLIMAAAAFHTSGHTGVTEIQDAHALLAPLLGPTIAPAAFAIALIAAGQASTITGTLAGQIIMEGFVQIRLRPEVRRLVTRGVAIIPAVLTIVIAGERATGNLLILSQVVLSLQLSFAVIPLIHLVSDRRWVGQYRIHARTQVASWLVALVIAGLNLGLVYQEIGGWMAKAGGHAWILWVTVVPVCAGAVALLGYVTVVPLRERLRGGPTPAFLGVHGPEAMPDIEPSPSPRHIAVAVDFSGADTAAMSYAVGMAQRGKSRVLLLHVVESGSARLLGDDMGDRESRSDQARLELYTAELGELGVAAEYDLGFGRPVEELARLAGQHRVDFLVMGSHGHKGLGDLLHGTTVEALRHQLDIPVLVVPTRASSTPAS